MKKILISMSLLAFISCRTKSTNSDPTIINQPKQSVINVSMIEKNILIRKYDPKMLKHIEQLVTLLKSGGITYYDWSNNCSCNVGLMAQLISNKSAKEIKLDLNAMSDYTEYSSKQHKRNATFQEGSWSNMTNFYCGVTNKKGESIIGELQSAGFSSLDISGLEYLSDKYILSKTDIKQKGEYWTDIDNLTNYLEAWANIIKVQIKDQN